MECWGFDLNVSSDQIVAVSESSKVVVVNLDVQNSGPRRGTRMSDQKRRM